MGWKRLGRRILFPPGWWMVVLTVVSTAALVCVFGKGWQETPIAYVVYPLSAYTLTVVCLFFGAAFPKRYKKLKERMVQHPLGSRYLTDLTFKNQVSLCCSLGMNMLYVGTNIFSAVWYRSGWFGILAGYYTVLAVMRFLLVRYLRGGEQSKQRLVELQYVRVCARILTTVSLLLAGVVWMILYWGRGFVYNGMLIYIMAIYAFYTVISAIIALIRGRKYKSPVLSMSKVIQTTAALVSMLALETAMFAQFGGEMSLREQNTMIAVTGAGISILVMTMAIGTSVRATKEINQIRRRSQDGE